MARNNPLRRLTDKEIRLESRRSQRRVPKSAGARRRASLIFHAAQQQAVDASHTARLAQDATDDQSGRWDAY